MNDADVSPDRIAPSRTPSTDTSSRAMFGGLTGLTAGALVGAALCWFVGRINVVWLGGVIGAVLGPVGGAPSLWVSRSRSDLARLDIATAICVAYGLLFAPLILLGAGDVRGRMSFHLLLGLGMAGPMLGLLLGGVLDRVYEASRKNNWAVALASGVIGLTTFVGIPALTATLYPPPDPVKLAVKARSLLLHEYQKNPQTRNATVTVIHLAHEADQLYVGVAEVTINGEVARMRLEVVVTDYGFEMTVKPMT